MTNKSMTVTSRGVTVRDFTIFQLKLALEGTKDFVAFWLSVVAIVLGFMAGRGRRPRLFYSVVRASERFDKWLNLHSAVQRMDEGTAEDGFFDGSDAGEDSLIWQIEQLVRGGEEGRDQAVRRLRFGRSVLSGTTRRRSEPFAREVITAGPESPMGGLSSSPAPERFMKYLRVLGGACVALVLAVAPVTAQDVSGSWEISSEGRRGPQTMTLTLVQDGAELTGTVTLAAGGRRGGRGGGGGMQTVELSDGTVDGAAFSFSLVRSFNGNSITQAFSGTIAGDSMEGAIEGGRGGGQPFAGRRAG